MVSTMFWLPTTAEKRQNFQNGWGRGKCKKNLGATDQPRYNGFRVISIRVITTLQCTYQELHLCMILPHFVTYWILYVWRSLVTGWATYAYSEICSLQKLELYSASGLENVKLFTCPNSAEHENYPATNYLSGTFTWIWILFISVNSMLNFDEINTWVKQHFKGEDWAHRHILRQTLCMTDRFIKVMFATPYDSPATHTPRAPHTNTHTFIIQSI